MIEFRTLMSKMEVLASMCDFKQPTILCTKEELFYRRLLTCFDEDTTNLVNGLTTQGENE